MAIANPYDERIWRGEMGTPGGRRVGPAPPSRPGGAVVCDDKDLPKPGETRGLGRGKVQCTSPKDALLTLSGVIARSVKMLDNTIGELVRARDAACRGEPMGWPNLGDLTACWLKYRLGVCIDDLSAWTGGTFKSRTVAEVIRRLVRPRNLIASNAIAYECDAKCDDPTTNAWVNVRDNAGACIRTPERVIHLCPPFWAPERARYREQVIIHEAVHLTHCAGGVEDTATGVSIGSPECLSQFVVSTNGKTLDPVKAGRCGFTTRCGRVSKECHATAPGKKPTLPDWQPKRPVSR